MRGHHQNDKLKFVVAQRDNWRLHSSWPPRLALMILAALFLAWAWPKTGSQSSRDSKTTSQSNQTEKAAVPTPDPAVADKKICKKGFVSVERLRGCGLSVEKFVEVLNAAHIQPVRWETPELQAQNADMRLCGYEGDAELPFAEALALLTFTDLSAEAQASDSFVVHGLRSKDQLWQFLASKVDPDGPHWGALRPWRALRVSSQRNFQTILDAAAPGSPTSVAGLTRAVGGSDRTLKTEEDGSMHWHSDVLPDELQLAALASFLEDVKKSSAYLTEPRLRAAVANVFGAILSRNSTAQLPNNHPTLVTLASLLADPDVEVARSAALALGHSASVSAIELLVKSLENTTEDSEIQAAVLTGLWCAETLGRQLDSETLGVSVWERRRDLFAQLRTRLIEYIGKKQPANIDLAYAAAWLSATEQFAPDALMSEYSTALRTALEQSKESPAQWIKTEFANRKSGALSEPVSAKLSDCVAGPLYMRYRFTCTLAHQLLISNEPRNVQAALWRLNRPESLQPEFGIDDESLRLISSCAVSIAQNDTSPILRNLALATLYRERKSLTTEKKYWRLYNDASFAMGVYLSDADPVIQLTAADALAQFGGASEIGALAQKDLTNRSPESLDRLLTGLVRQQGRVDAQAEGIRPPFIDLAEHLLQSSNDTVSIRAAWARMHDPSLDVVARIRLLKSFRSPLQREAAVRALAEITKRDTLPPKLISVLLADQDPRVRAAVISTGLAHESTTK